MNATVEARSLIEQIGSGYAPGTPLKTILARVATAVGVPQRRIRALWNGEVNRPHSDEMDALRAAAERRAKGRVGTDELAELRAKVAHLERLLMAAEEHGRRRADQSR